MPVGEFMIGVKRTALPSWRAGHGGHRAGARRLAGLRQGRRAQRDGDRHRRRVPGRRRAGRSVRLALGSVAPTIVRAAEAEAFAAATVDWDARRVVDAEAVAEFGALAAAASTPDRRPPVDRRLPAARRRGARRPAAAPGVPGRRIDERAVPPARQRRAPRRRRRLARREPALRAARAARPATARRGRASRASAGRAACSSTASWCARASCSAASAVGLPIVTIEGLAEPGVADRRAAGVRRRRRRAVRVLHAGAGDGRARPARPQRRSRRRREIREELSGNICRCTGYGRIIDAVQRVAVAAARRAGR